MGKKSNSVMDVIQWGRQTRQQQRAADPIEGGRPTCVSASLDLQPGASHAFKLPEFAVGVGGGRALVHLRVTATGGEGQLQLDGEVARPGQIVTVRDLYAGSLQFVSAEGASGWFEFEVFDGALYSSGAARMTMLRCGEEKGEDVMDVQGLCGSSEVVQKAEPGRGVEAMMAEAVVAEPVVAEVVAAEVVVAEPVSVHSKPAKEPRAVEESVVETVSASAGSTASAETSGEPVSESPSEPASARRACGVPSLPFGVTHTRFRNARTVPDGGRTSRRVDRPQSRLGSTRRR